MHTTDWCAPDRSRAQHRLCRWQNAPLGCDCPDCNHPKIRSTVAPAPKPESDPLVCSCGKRCTSKPGLTLHRKKCLTTGETT